MKRLAPYALITALLIALIWTVVPAPTYTYVVRELAQTFTALQTFGAGLTVSSGQKVGFEGSAGDTYWTRDASVQVLDAYKDGTLAATVRADSFGPPACPSDFGTMAPGICIQSSTGLLVFKDASGAFYRDGTVAQ